jgi:hypothetical protein
VASVRLMVVDACQAGGLTRLKGGEPAEPFDIVVDDQIASEGMAIITSSAHGEDAQESDRLQSGVFTHHFIAGLHGAADSSGDARVTLNEAFDYGYRQTLESTSQAPVLQHPSFAYHLRGQRELVLTTLDANPQMGRLRLREAGDYLVFAAALEGALVAEVRVDGGAVLSLPAGTYVLRRREPAAVWQGAVNIAPQELVELGSDGMEQLPYGSTVRRGYTQRRSALGLQVGLGVTGPPLPELSLAPSTQLGLRLDLEQLTLSAGVRGQRATAASQELTQTYRALGAELGATRLFDLRPVSVGLGVRAGLEGVRQDFETTGDAPSRQALIGRFGSVLAMERALTPSLLTHLELGLDVALLPLEDDGLTQLSTQVVPYASLSLVGYRPARLRRRAG